MIWKSLSPNKEKENKKEKDEIDMEKKYDENIKSVEDCLNKLKEVFNKIGK